MLWLMFCAMFAVSGLGEFRIIEGQPGRGWVERVGLVELELGEWSGRAGSAATWSWNEPLGRFGTTVPGVPVRAS